MPTKMTATPWLLTGVTGSLGAKILHDMLHIHNVPASNIIATGRSEANRSRFESQGLQFRVADYDRPDTLLNAFQGVDNLLFMSSTTRDSAIRSVEHANVIEAAKAVGVGRVWYVSLALGGFGSASKIAFQQSHYKTEELLQQSGLNFVNLRAGVYSDAFPMFLNWYPSSKAVLFPQIDPPVTESRIAFASRRELGEAIATLFAKGLAAFPSIKLQTEKNIILLSGPKAESLVELVDAINRVRGTSIPIQYLDPQDWITACSTDDVGGKGRAWFEARLVYTEGVSNGDGEVVDPALETLLGRKPETGTQSIQRLLEDDPEYTWHQNHVN